MGKWRQSENNEKSIIVLGANNRHCLLPSLLLGRQYSSLLLSSLQKYLRINKQGVGKGYEVEDESRDEGGDTK